MSLTLSVLTFRNQPPQRTISKRFSGVGGTIGRLEGNDLALPDPERIVSRTHARVEFRDGAYFLVSLGQNPIDLNGQPLGSGGTAELTTGDRLTIGGYCIVAQIEDERPAPRPSSTASLVDRPLSDLDFPLRAEAEGRMAFGIDLGGAAPSRSAESAPPPDHLPLSAHGVQRDQVPGFLEPLPRTAPAVQIPDDYDLLRGLDAGADPLMGAPVRAAVPPKQAPSNETIDPFAESADIESPPRPNPPAPTLPAPVTSRPLPAEPASPPEARRPDSPVTPARPADAYAQALRTLLQAAGVPELEERALANPEFMRSVGDLLRESVAGLLKALVARALTKRELRVDMTMLASTENNPLKFCPDAFEALNHLLAPRARSGYLPPIRAVREAYEDLQAHNLAVMAGMRAALQGVLQRFDPAQLEKQLASHPLLDKLLPHNRKARMWDLVADQHETLVREAQDEFDRIFGRAFRAAYEEQLQKLRTAASRGQPS